MDRYLSSPAFKQSRPVLLTTFVNKVASIGLSLVSILLVRRGVSTAEGSLVLSTMKGTLLVGTLIGGALSDRLSPRALVLAALLLSATGVGLLPFAASVWLILLLAVAGQFAEALLNVVQRILLMDLVDFEHQKESLGWLRMVANFAQIFSFSIAAAGSGLGLAPLMLGDAATSLGAFFLARRILPRVEVVPEKGRGLGAGERAEGPASKSAFLRCALVLLGYAFFYELFIEGGSGRMEALHPGEGLRRFSTMMILNTVVCAAFAVQASRLFRKSFDALVHGLLLTAAGVLIAGWGAASQYWVFGGALLISVGEVMIGAVAQYTLMRLTPSDRSAGFYYSTGLMLMQCGRIAGAALAFPILIRTPSLAPYTALVLGALAIQLLVLRSLKADVELYA